MSGRKINVIYIVSSVNKALAFEWIDDFINKELFDLKFILLGQRSSVLYKFLKQKSTTVYDIQYTGKMDFLQAFLKVSKIILHVKPDVVHTHLFEANIIGLTSSWLLRINKRIYTRHHATIHYTEFPKGLKWDRWCNFIATDVIAISNNVREILVTWDKVDPRKVHLIYHGFDFKYFQQVSTGRIDSLRSKYSISKLNAPVIGVISRYMEWKGIQYTITAFNQLLLEYPTAHLVLANAHGSFENQIKLLLKDLPKESYTEIVFENDLAALYKLFDVFVHVPIDKYSEAFGQTYIESLIAGIPSVFTLSGIANEFIVDEENALVVEFCNTNEIVQSVMRILSSLELRNSLVNSGRATVTQFTIARYVDNLEKLYLP